MVEQHRLEQRSNQDLGEQFDIDAPRDIATRLASTKDAQQARPAGLDDPAANRFD